MQAVNSTNFDDLLGNLTNVAEALGLEDAFNLPDAAVLQALFEEFLGDIPGISDRVANLIIPDQQSVEERIRILRESLRIQLSPGGGQALDPATGQVAGLLNDREFERALQKLERDAATSVKVITDEMAAGLDEGAADVGTAMSNVTQEIRDHLNSSAAKKGPMAEEGWAALTAMGGVIIAQLIRGFQGHKDEVGDAFGEALSGILSSENLQIDINFDPVARQVAVSLQRSMDRNTQRLREVGDQIAVELFSGALVGVIRIRDEWDAIVSHISVYTRGAAFARRMEFQDIGENIVRAIAAGMSRGIRHIDDAIQDLSNKIQKKWGDVQFANLGANFTSQLSSGITGSSDTLDRAMTDLLINVPQFLPASPAQKGPLSGAGDPMLGGRGIVDRIIEGMREREVGLSSAFSEILTPLGSIGGGGLSLPVSTGTGMGASTTSITHNTNATNTLTINAADPTDPRVRFTAQDMMNAWR
jgi:hypothetical protein